MVVRSSTCMTVTIKNLSLTPIGGASSRGTSIVVSWWSLYGINSVIISIRVAPGIIIILTWFVSGQMLNTAVLSHSDCNAGNSVQKG